MINGTQAMSAVGSLALLAAERLADAADVTGAISLEALKGTPVAFDHKIQAVRAHPGQMRTARRLRDPRVTSRSRGRSSSAGRIRAALHASSTRSGSRRARSRSPHSGD